MTSFKNALNQLTKLIILTTVIFSTHVNAFQSPVSLNERTKSDSKRDLSSQPLAVLEFSQVKKGDRVLDLFAGGGYYSELLSKAVGDNGSITLHNNKAYLPYIGKELEARIANNRLPNVAKLMSEADDLKLEANYYDIAFFVLGYHDLFVVDKNWTVTEAQVIPQLTKSLKKGAKLLIIDHDTEKGIGISQTQKLHRIERSFVIQSLKAKGFGLIDSSNLLVEKSDPLNISVFAPEVRRKTSRFVLLFEKL